MEAACSSKTLMSAYRTAWGHMKKTTKLTAVITSKHIGTECTLIKVVGQNFSFHAFSHKPSLHEAQIELHQISQK
jgi:hypothetical protein